MPVLNGKKWNPIFVAMRIPILVIPFLCAAWTDGTAQTIRMPERAPETSPYMTVEIWSDVVCPFCYIGKREFERALEQFEHKDVVHVVWKSFELDPEAPARSEHDMYGMLVAKYGGTREDAAARVAQVVERAKTVGLEYRMDIAVIGNSFDAHRLLQFAKTKDRGDTMKERLLKAYFMEGVQLADADQLLSLAKEVGLDAEQVSEVLRTDAFADAVRSDEAEARQLGVRGVPFFVLDRKYGVSGAQSSEHFLGALDQAWKEREGAKP